MKVQEVQIKDAYISSKSVSHKRKKLYDILEKSFIVAGINNNINGINSNEYVVYKIPLIKKFQKGNEIAFSISDGEIVIGENVSLVKITQNFGGAILNSYCVNTQKNDASINELRDYDCPSTATNSESNNASRSTSISSIVEVKQGDRLKMVIWSTTGNISKGIISKEPTTLTVEKIA